MKNRTHVFLAASFALSLFLMGWTENTTVAGRVAWAQPCEPVTVGLDTTSGNMVDVAFFGRAWAQIFFAPDTLIKSITVWRPGPDPNVNMTPGRLYITEVESLSTYLAPAVNQILLEGPSMSVPYAPEHHLPMRYEFDPPFVLPRIGTFALAIKEDSQGCGGILPLLFDSLNTYSEGIAWHIHPTVICDLGIGRTPYENIDMIFEVEFCRPPTTDVPFPRRDSWGKLKAFYR